MRRIAASPIAVLKLGCGDEIHEHDAFSMRRRLRVAICSRG